uniref:Uncharacterized protein n=1 Tax=Avena sativa TaxID=4498 RepID=A0ACD5W723_AVESA
MAAHLFSHCRFTKRLWILVKAWLGLPNFNVDDWTEDLSIKDWWTKLACKTKAMASITMLISWTIWKERNARVFNNKFAQLQTLLDIIKREARLWILAGAKSLSFVILGE